MRMHIATFTLLTACAAESPQGEASNSVDSGAEQACGPDAPTGLSVGECALDFTLPDSTGEAFTLSAQRGKVALVDISAIW